MKTLHLTIGVIATALMITTPAAAAGKSDSASGKKYEYIQVNRFDVQQGVDLPPDYQLTIVEGLVSQLGKIKGVKQVLREGETLPPEQPVLVVTGTVTGYKKGNQAARYLVGFGAGTTVVKAHFKCYDTASKATVLELDADGKVIMGIMGGKSEGANNGLAKEIAKDIQHKFY